MLKDIINATKLPHNFCASLIGVDPIQFQEWLEGARPVPSFIIPELSTVLGVSEKRLTEVSSQTPKIEERITPAVWYKLRDAKLGDLDREMVGLVRKLGFFLGQLQQVRGGPVLEYAPVFGAIRSACDKKAPPSAQGSQAAAAFRSVSGLQHGQAGIGELIRGYFRRIGILVIESPLKHSSLEGCCFSVGASSVPCIFVNSLNSTWFRRNSVLMHELCHAIFDLEDDPVAIDFIDPNESEQPKFNEARAQAFAQDALIPQSVLVQFVNRFGLHWDELTPQDLGRLVASAHVEQKLVLAAAFDAGFIDEEQRATYDAFSCAPYVREYSDHALSTREYLKQRVGESPKWIAENRNTEVGTRKLRLPVRYVDEVIKALNDGVISLGKAAEMTMMERGTFTQRFRDLMRAPGLE